MACEVWFYHLERTGLDQALPELLLEDDGPRLAGACAMRRPRPDGAPGRLAVELSRRQLPAAWDGGSPGGRPPTDPAHHKGGQRQRGSDGLPARRGGAAGAGRLRAVRGPVRRTGWRGAGRGAGALARDEGAEPSDVVLAPVAGGGHGASRLEATRDAGRARSRRARAAVQGGRSGPPPPLGRCRRCRSFPARCCCLPRVRPGRTFRTPAARRPSPASSASRGPRSRCRWTSPAVAWPAPPARLRRTFAWTGSTSSMTPRAGW